MSPELRERIFEVAEELGYGGPDASARALVKRRTGLVGVQLTSSPHEALDNLVALGSDGSSTTPTRRGWAGISSAGRIVPPRSSASAT